MADNKLLLKRDSDQDFLAEDDPLAELARIVGFDPAPAAKVQAAQRREPAFDLEDELLKELEIYAQPADVEPAVAAAPAYAPAAEPMIHAAPANPAAPFGSEAVAPEIAAESLPVREPVLLEAVETVADPSEGRVYERPASHPVFDLEDEILREFAAFDARGVGRTEERHVEAEIVHQDPPAPERAQVPSELHDVPDLRTMTSAVMPREHGRDVYESFRSDDLDDAISAAFSSELEETPTPPVAAPRQAMAVLDPGLVAVAAEPVAAASAEDAGGVSGAGRADHVPAEAVAEPGVETASLATANASAPFVAASAGDDVEPIAEELETQNFSDFIPAVPAVAVQPLPQDIAPAAKADPVAAASDVYGLDALLAEVEKYPVTDTAARWGIQSKPIAAEEVARAAPPVVQDFAPLHSAQQGPGRQTAASTPSSGDVLEDGNFELDLDDIELDLSDLNENAVQANPGLLSEIADVPVAREEAVYRRPAASSDAADYSSLPFDPSQITQEEETFEAIAEMDVPDVPEVQEEEKPAPHPEYDIDLDAEMAQLFAAATAQPSTSARSAQSSDAPVSGAEQRASSLDLDEFERALEEDFRRSFAENRSASHPDRVALAPVYAQQQQGRGRRSLLLLASAAVAVVLFGGAGVYAFMSGNTKILASSEPKVILADTDPVKVVPDDPGGKQVPNQNKAVYDRVLGAVTDQTKQESLVTSNEEPVDVVQRTLMPETLPMDDDSMAAATPTGDTIDPRLLPDAEENDRVTTTKKVVSGVSPRKVKTMVVRPDGSLVEREVTEEDLKQQASNDAELMKIAQKAAQDAATASDSQTDDIAKAIENVPERLAPNDENAAANPAETMKARSVKVEDVRPATAAESEVAAVEPVKIEDAKPSVVDKPTPVEQPAVAENPVDTAVTPAANEAEVAVERKPVETPVAERPAETAVAEKPAERSINVDTGQSVVDQDAAMKAADADVQAEDAPVRKVKTTKITPVPEVRPVDQPVTVVGTVTDNGTVRSKTDEKPQDVALADATPQTTSAPSGSYVIQIASLPSEAEAQTSYSRLSAKFAGIIGGKGVDIRRADIKNKGTYYRVRILAGSKQDAQALCSQYKKAGGSCLVSR